MDGSLKTPVSVYLFAILGSSLAGVLGVPNRSLVQRDFFLVIPGVLQSIRALFWYSLLIVIAPVFYAFLPMLDVLLDSLGVGLISVGGAHLNSFNSLRFTADA